MTKTLKTIQTLHKVGKILSTIIFVCCCIGIGGCALGLILLPVLTNVAPFLIDTITITAEVPLGGLYAVMAAGLVLCIAEAVVSRVGMKYFANELVAGTPFTLKGSKELLRLGLTSIIASVAGVVVAAIICAIIDAVTPGVIDVDLGNASSVGMGIMLCMGSLLCRLGAEQNEKAE